MKQKFVFLIFFSIILVVTSCTFNTNFLAVTPTFTSTTVVSSTPTLTNITTSTSVSVVETDVPVSSSVQLPIGDGGILSSQPCKSPCFFGVRLGETKFDEIIPILKNNGLSPCFKDLRSDSYVSVVCGIDKPIVRVGVDEDILIVNEIGYVPSISLSVGDLIAKYNEPNHVTVLYTRDLSNILRIYAILYWDSHSMRVVLPEVEDKEEHTYQIENSTKVEGIYFSREEIYIKSSSEESEVWKGYGVYEP